MIHFKTFDKADGIYFSNRNFGRSCRFEVAPFASNCIFQECCYFPGGAKLTDCSIHNKCRFEQSAILQDCEIHDGVEFQVLDAVKCKLSSFVSFNTNSSLYKCNLELPFRIWGDGELKVKDCTIDGSPVSRVWSLDNIILLEYTSGVQLVQLPMFRLTPDEALKSHYTTNEEKEKVRKILEFSKRS